MRVNMDSSIATDPRFKLLGRALGISWREAIGSCFLIWLTCYERRSKCLRRVEADIAAELDGFADALVSVGLADAGEGDVIDIHGVEQRIEFLMAQARKGAVGGKRSGESRASKSRRPRAGREANASAPASAGREANAQANASGSAQAYPLDLDLDLDPPEASAPPTRPPTPTVEQAVEDTPELTTPPLSAQAEVEGAPRPQVQHRTLRAAPPPTHGGEVDEKKNGAAQKLLSATTAHGVAVRGARRATSGPKSLPFTVRDLGQAFAKGAQNAFAGDSWDGGLAKPVTSVIRALCQAGRDLSDVERAGRLVKGWRLSEPLTWAWIAKAGNLAGAIAKAHGTEATRAAAQAARGEFQDWGRP